MIGRSCVWAHFSFIMTLFLSLTHKIVLILYQGWFLPQRRREKTWFWFNVWGSFPNSQDAKTKVFKIEPNFLVFVFFSSCPSVSLEKMRGFKTRLLFNGSIIHALIRGGKGGLTARASFTHSHLISIEFAVCSIFSGGQASIWGGLFMSESKPKNALMVNSSLAQVDQQQLGHQPWLDIWLGTWWMKWNGHSVTHTPCVLTTRCQP